MSVHINAQLHALENSYAASKRGSIGIKVMSEGGLQGKTQVFELDTIHTYEGHNLGSLNFCARKTSGVPI